jgi:post-segregation antitoxin (ccd killing protein)
MKAQAMCSVDHDLLSRAREEKLNISNVLNDALKQAFWEQNSKDPEVKERHLREKTAENRAEIERLSQELAKNEQEIKNLEQEKVVFAEKLRVEALARAEKYKKEVKQEISYWPTFISKGFLSTQRKRDMFFKQRAKELNMSLENYLNDIVEPAARVVAL